MPGGYRMPPGAMPGYMAVGGYDDSPAKRARAAAASMAAHHGAMAGMPGMAGAMAGMPGMLPQGAAKKFGMKDDATAMILLSMTGGSER